MVEIPKPPQNMSVTKMVLLLGILEETWFSQLWKAIYEKQHLNILGT